MAEKGVEARQVAALAILERDRLNYPAGLPITDRHDELLEVIRDHQVVIVAGETGSGKSTQIPKLCVEAGQGIAGVIGHTQPRRVAARTIAERVAEELQTEIGKDVGYSVRFTDNISDGTLIRVMTDGILLAEIQRDRMLRRYDTLIIDEAHERSLNIDFIMGYLKQLLPKRPDLKVIVTSATIDTDRFAKHFAFENAEGVVTPAPIVTVSGRSFPVEIRYRPFGEDDTPDDGEKGPAKPKRIDQRDQVEAIVDACAELADEGDGDVLVFLSGEREILDTAEAIKQRKLSNTEVLPLYARLSSAEQQRVWKPHKGRRIVLATNVAETSITVPGVRYVVDAGTARISRYSRRLKVQRLPIEDVSKASANQRAGRCGRVAAGVCIRLYSEENFEARDDFTEPEILRTNLASVILQMANIGLGDLARFPFVEPPDRRAIRDGENLLVELGAISERSDERKPDPNDHRPQRVEGVQLTKIGRKLARLPADPRLGRMLLEAEHRNCVREVLVIVSALSIQDVRERPAEKREQSNEMHNRFKVKGSDLLSIVKLWDYVQTQQRELSGNRFRRMCREEFIHYLRVREWADLHRQLKRVAADMGIKAGTEEGHPDHVHQALLAGLLSHIGMRDRETRNFKGARQAEFVIAPGSVLTRKSAPWVMAAELVETNQIYARRVAEIDPRWAEKAGEHLVKRSYGNVRWDPKGGRAVVTEQVTLFGLPLVSDRVIGYDRVDPDAARAWFITKAFVEGPEDGRRSRSSGDQVAAVWRGRQKFMAHNDDVLDRLASMSDRTRGVEIIDDEALFAFYDARVGADVTSTQHFDRWWKQERQQNGRLFHLTDKAVRELVGEHGHGFEDYPDVWLQGDIELPLTYRYAPREPLDGVTVHLPLNGLNQLTDEGFDWQVPGHRDEVVEQLMRSLPKAIRRTLIPFSETVDQVLDRLGQPSGRLVDRLGAVLTEVSGVNVRALDFDPTVIDPHLKLNIVVSDDQGEVHDVGFDLAAIKMRLVGSARESIARAAPIDERRGITKWDLGDIPRVVESTDLALDVKAYPTLLDVGESVSLRVVTTPELQKRAMRGGVRRLLLLNGAPTRASVERLITNAGRLALTGADIGVTAIVDDCIAAAVDMILDASGTIPFTEAEFMALQAEVKAKASNRAGTALGAAVGVVAAAGGVNEHLARMRAPALHESVSDANLHLGRLVRPGFISVHGIERLPDIERYVHGIRYRLENLAGAADRDRVRMVDVLALERRFAAFVDIVPVGEMTADAASIRWMLEELRIQVFAQPIGTKGSVSIKKINQRLAAAGA